VEDADLVKELVEKQIPLTTCPLSNVRLCVYSDLGKHPLKQLLEAGVSVTANSDDPPYFGGYLLENWLSCARELQLEERHLVQLAKNSFTGSFLPEKEKAQWITKIDRVVSSLGGGSSS
jgi:adenosine deaminase